MQFPIPGLNIYAMTVYTELNERTGAIYSTCMHAAIVWGNAPKPYLSVARVVLTIYTPCMHYAAS